MTIRVVMPPKSVFDLSKLPKKRPLDKPKPKKKPKAESYPTYQTLQDCGP